MINEDIKKYNLECKPYPISICEFAKSVQHEKEIKTQINKNPSK